ncbi:hypothetical protein KPZU09_41920 [Klebsiella pneumoniae]|uniref:Nucleoside permease NupC n=1 Tax=Klebsiella pneumoniae TaxID=573 RepID=A0A919HTD6_KLEPN|nr:hypothetical protein KPZU09_41920 [Klebsiella pneumoniae]
MQILMGLIGMVALLAIAVLLSNNRKAINLRTVLGAWIIQVGIGALILYVPAGRAALLAMSNGVASVIAYGNEGISFIFGGLVSDKMFEVFGGGGFVFALRVLPVIVFFSSLIAVLYYLGIMQLVIRILGGALRAVLKTSRTESLSATANIFVGQTEAPLVVRPYIATMTRSELFAVMCGGRPRWRARYWRAMRRWAFRWSTLLPRRLWRRREACCLPKLSYQKRKNRTITRLMTAKALTRINRPTCWMPPPPAPRLVCNWRSTSARCCWRLLR